MSYLFIFKSVLQVAVAQAGDVPDVLAREAGDTSREVQREGQLDQLGCRG